MIRNCCNIFWLMEVSTPKAEGMMKFSIRFWSGYLHQLQKYYNDSLKKWGEMHVVKNVLFYIWEMFLPFAILQVHGLVTIYIIYSWNSLTRSRWDQRKYFELSEVRVKHQLCIILFMSIEVGYSTFRVMVQISHDVDTLSNWFCVFWTMSKHEKHI